MFLRSLHFERVTLVCQRLPFVLLLLLLLIPRLMHVDRRWLPITILVLEKELLALELILTEALLGRLSAHFIGPTLVC